MRNFSPLVTLIDTLSKATGLIISISIIIGIIGGGLAYLHIGQQSHLPYTTTESGTNMTFSSNAGFKITYPAALSYSKEKNSTLNPKVKIFFNPQHLDKINVATDDDYIGQNLTIHDVMTDYNRIETALMGFRLISQDGNATLGGLPAFKTVETVNQQNWDENLNTTIKTMWILGMNSGRVYIVSYNALVNEYDMYLPQAQQIIDSFSYT